MGVFIFHGEREEEERKRMGDRERKGKKNRDSRRILMSMIAVSSLCFSYSFWYLGVYLLVYMSWWLVLVLDFLSLALLLLPC